MGDMTEARAAIAAAGLAVLSTSAAGAQSGLEWTWWVSDSDCTITALFFYPGGTVDIDYYHDEHDTGIWTLRGNSLSIEFDYFGDTFVGIYAADRITAVHSYRLEGGDTLLTENCVFEKI